MEFNRNVQSDFTTVMSLYSTAVLPFKHPIWPAALGLGVLACADSCEIPVCLTVYKIDVAVGPDKCVGHCTRVLAEHLSTVLSLP